MSYKLSCPAVSCSNDFTDGNEWAEHIKTDHPLFVGAVFDLEGVVYAQ